MKNLAFAALVALALVGCRREDVRQFAVSVPEMTEADVPVVVARLVGVPHRDERTGQMVRNAQGELDLAGGYDGVRACNPVLGVPPYRKLDFDPVRHVLTLRYDSMKIAKKNIEMAIAELGFTANGVTPQSIGAQPKAR